MRETHLILYDGQPLHDVAKQVVLVGNLPLHVIDEHHELASHHFLGCQLLVGGIEGQLHLVLSVLQNLNAGLHHAFGVRMVVVFGLARGAGNDAYNYNGETVSKGQLSSKTGHVLEEPPISTSASTMFSSFLTASTMR